MITPAKDELTADDPGVDETTEENTVEKPTELPIEDTGLLLVGAKLDDPPPPPQASNDMQQHKSSNRIPLTRVARAIVILIFSLMWLYPC